MEILEGLPSWRSGRVIPSDFPRIRHPRFLYRGDFGLGSSQHHQSQNIIIAAAAGSRNILIRLQENSGQTGFGGRTDPDGLTKRIAWKAASLTLELKWSLRRVLIGLAGSELGSREGFSFPGRAADRHQQGYNCHFFGFKPLLHLQLKSGHHCSQYPNLITTTTEHQNRKSQTYQCIIGRKSSYLSIFFLQFITMLCFEEYLAKTYSVESFQTFHLDKDLELSKGGSCDWRIDVVKSWGV